METTKPRNIVKTVKAQETKDGDGAFIKRSIGTTKLDTLDPFLMLDEFFVTPPAGFPDHPHRGFETVTYMLDGAFKHADNKGHKGTINPGDLQWMTAGRGIVHSEQPATNGVNHGLQLWVNLAAKDKMCEPSYQELLSADIPEVNKDGVKVRIIAGESRGVSATVRTKTPTLYLDVKIEPSSKFTQPIDSEYNGFVYVLSGAGLFGGDKEKGTEGHTLVLGGGSELSIENDGKDMLHFVIVAGKPIKEPVAKYGPFVMNTQQEIQQAFKDFYDGKF
eukprot:TRINITY_DN6403_c0_g4_i2.p1 TRINITY_DN6403_c0_g4~~TRINITY_DN6403_c0_g4_i2.p1  ORF type:complete len:276 (-),score=65.95 TRINITY_DN6403_c0_g4_i2:82-909(-)